MNIFQNKLFPPFYNKSIKMILFYVLVMIVTSSVTGQHLRVSSGEINDQGIKYNHKISAGMTSDSQASPDRSSLGYGYEKHYKSICRTDNWENGSGKEENDIYEHKSRGECEDKCTDSYWCVGFEWNELGRCKIWKDSRYNNYSSGYDKSICYWKNWNTKVEYDRNDKSACRTDSGRKGDDNDEYYLYSGRSKNECEGKCSHNAWCTGFEWDKNERCEIWFYKSKKHGTERGENQKKNKAICSWKK